MENSLKNQIQPDVVYLSRKETIKDLKEKIIRICKRKFEKFFKFPINAGITKIWKLDPKLSTEEISSLLNINNKSKPIKIRAKKLDDVNPLEVPSFLFSICP